MSLRVDCSVQENEILELRAQSLCHALEASIVKALYESLRSARVLDPIDAGHEGRGIATANDNKVGHLIVAHYVALPDEGDKGKRPGGDCYAVTHSRVARALSQACGLELQKLGDFSSFDRLWAIKLDPKNTWRLLPIEYRGKGAPGAMAYIGKGRLIEGDDVWAGGLQPGAVMQTWSLASDYRRVTEGDLPQRYGHSFIFLQYITDGLGGRISGMRIADQGFQSDTILTRSSYEFWVGANIKC